MEEKVREKDAPRLPEESKPEKKFAVYDETTGEYNDIDVSEIIRSYEESKAIHEKVAKSPNRRELEKEKAQQLNLVERLGVQRPNVPVYLPQEDQQQEDDNSYEEIELPDFENKLPEMASLFQTQLPAQQISE